VDYADLPVIDLSKSGTLEERLALANQLKDAMSSHGFFYIINHGYSKSQVPSFNTDRHKFSYYNSFP
jgi:isopenicillin N synthase-like dioxygenase